MGHRGGLDFTAKRRIIPRGGNLFPVGQAVPSHRTDLAAYVNKYM
jgi:hypothetical protein